LRRAHSAVLRLLLRAIAVEAVAAQHSAERDGGSLRSGHIDAGYGCIRVTGQVRGGMASSLLECKFRKLAGLAEADHDDPRKAGAWCKNSAGLALGSLE
jgi:hypothetical protein